MGKREGEIRQLYFPFSFIRTMDKLKKIQPIENFIFEGMVNRLQQTFGCYTQYCNSPEVLLEMQKVRKNVKFPFLLFSLSSMSAMDEFYHTNYLARKGINVAYKAQNVTVNVKLIPCKFEFNCNYFTNANAGPDSILFFMKRWLFARRLGYLKFTVNYGEQNYGCHVELDESVTQPEKEPSTDASSFYKAECRLSVFGFISEAQLVDVPQVVTVKTALQVGQDSTAETKSFYWNKR